MLLIGLPHERERLFPAWQARSGWPPVAQKILARTGQRAGGRAPAILFVYGEPGLFYHLNSLGSQLVVASANLNFPDAADSPATLFLVAGPHAQRTPGYVEEFARGSSRLELIERLPYTPSNLVLLDQYHPRDLPTEQQQEVLLYAVQ
jgi:hypothetical protein